MVTKKKAPAKATKRARKPKMIPVVVTTANRGVFFGYLDPRTADDDVLVLESARNCVYWSRVVRGFLGLAATGPNAECRIGPAAPRMRVRNVTSVVECSTAAVKAWEAAPWG